jgi:hypothetical protein
MKFRSRIDYSDNRQITQREKTFSNLSGGTLFGLPYSGLTNGIDSTTTGNTSNTLGTVSTFSGNSATTIYTWYDSDMSIAEQNLVPLTSSNSGDTQETGIVFVPNQTGVTEDGYNYVINYSGISYDVEVTNMTVGPGPIYQGSVKHNLTTYYSGNSLDYSGRTIWIDNPEITRTKRLIINDNPNIGYVFTCLNSEGEGVWLPASSGGTGGIFNNGLTTTSGITQFDGPLIKNTSIDGNSGTHSLSFENINYFSVFTPSYADYINVTSGQVLLRSQVTKVNGLTELLLYGGDDIIIQNDNTDPTQQGAKYNDGTNNVDYSTGWTVTTPDSMLATKGYVDSNSGGDFLKLDGTSEMDVGASIVFDKESFSNAKTYIENTGIFKEFVDPPQPGDNTDSNNAFTIQSTARLSLGANNQEPTVKLDIDTTSTRQTLYVPDTTFESGDYIKVEGMSTEANPTDYLGLDSNGYIRKVSVPGGSGNTSFVHSTTAFESGSHNAILGGEFININGEHNSIIGGVNNTIIDGVRDSILGGSGNTLNNTSNSVILGGVGITGITDNTVYTQNLKTLNNLEVSSLPSVSDLQTNLDGQLIDGASDKSLKGNIKAIINPLETILKLNPVSFEWVPEIRLRKGNVFGLIAQEVKEVLPDIVRERANGNGTLTLEYKELIPWIIGAIKELSINKSINTTEETILKTQVIVSEDNNIELNFGGNKKSSIGGGITIINGIDNEVNSEFTINSDGDWVTNNHMQPKGLIIPTYKPHSTYDSTGKVGEITRDDNYIYIKTKSGWKRSSLETF